MFSLFWASLLTLPTTVGPIPRALQLPLPDPRFYYTLGALTGPATAPTRTLWVKPTQGNHPTHSVTLSGPAALDPAQEVVVRDVNFDGHPDLMLTRARGLVNQQYDYWLYEASTQRFVHNTPLSNTLGGYQVTFDAATQHVVTAARFSCCEHQTRTYAFNPTGTLTLVATRTENVTAQPKSPPTRTAFFLVAFQLYVPPPFPTRTAAEWYPAGLPLPAHHRLRAAAYPYLAHDQPDRAGGPGPRH
ncbi:hypothetical protein F1C16_22280 (plasmid) [Hymenobacter sp. NBH84]|uniref:XAC2610-related protein n=1 Tax=Hymenobacter sp. NBH84 TaxID=2596915 RepID=UPI00162ACA90|nr:hypothetical protein [Hymenobacter sp. NBH84]QNE42351.1 hypothetical protein F1C16_22280 [Hymenobacter sp. NBH84]